MQSIHTFVFLITPPDNSKALTLFFIINIMNELFIYFRIIISHIEMYNLSHNEKSMSKPKRRRDVSTFYKYMLNVIV